MFKQKFSVTKGSRAIGPNFFEKFDPNVPMVFGTFLTKADKF